MKSIVGVFVALAIFSTIPSFSAADTGRTRLEKYKAAIEDLGGTNAQWDLSWAPQASLIPDATQYAFVQLSTTSLQFPTELEMFEVKNDLISDGYRNLVYFDWRAGHLWIQQYGGFAGRIHFYGPIKLSPEGKPVSPKTLKNGHRKIGGQK